MRLLLPGRCRYPDLMVVTGPPLPPGATSVTVPVAGVEVGAEVAEAARAARAGEYRACPSLLHNAVLEECGAATLVHSRDGGGWADRRLSGRGAVMDVPGIGVALPLAEIYDGLDLGHARDAVGDGSAPPWPRSAGPASG